MKSTLKILVFLSLLSAALPASAMDAPFVWLESYMCTDKITSISKPEQPPYMLVWLTEDNKTPLRREYGDDRLDFLNYVPGPQDPKWFEAQGVKQ